MQATGRFVVAIIAVALTRTALAGDEGRNLGANAPPYAFSEEAGVVALDDEVLESRASGVAIWRKGDGRLEVSHTPDSMLGLLMGPSFGEIRPPAEAPSPSDMPRFTTGFEVVPLGPPTSSR